VAQGLWLERAFLQNGRRATQRLSRKHFVSWEPVLSETSRLDSCGMASLRVIAGCSMGPGELVRVGEDMGVAVVSHVEGAPRFETLQVTPMRPTTASPPRRAGCIVVGFGERVFLLVGGRRDDGGLERDLWRCRLDREERTCEWSKVPCPDGSGECTGHSLALLHWSDGAPRIVRADSGGIAELVPDEGRWRRLACASTAAPPPRRHAVLVAMSDSRLLYHGGVGFGDLWLLTFAADSFEACQLDVAPCFRSSHAGTLVDSNALVVCGGIAADATGGQTMVCRVDTERMAGQWFVSSLGDGYGGMPALSCRLGGWMGCLGRSAESVAVIDGGSFVDSEGRVCSLGIHCISTRAMLAGTTPSIRGGAPGLADWSKAESVCVKLRKQLARYAVEVLGMSTEAAEELSLQDAPHRLQRLGSVALLPSESLRDARWGDGVWAWVAKHVSGVKQVARRAEISSGGTRRSRVELLVPEESGWTVVPENGVRYCVDVSRVMFSRGNITEKIRVAGLDAAGETVVDLFAGIGYWTVPLLLHGKAARVFARDWNPDALECLGRTAALNHVADRVDLALADSSDQHCVPWDCADRVVLGLIPSSECAWLTAVRALRPSGGVLHVHGNVSGTTALVRDAWGESVALRLEELAKSVGKTFRARCELVVKVKTYAPRVLHCVADVRLAPPPRDVEFVRE
jgi:tRNA G37 N-methylase Trm5